MESIALIETLIILFVEIFRRTREKIYCNRTGKLKKEDFFPNYEIDGSLQEHYSELLNAVRDQMDSHLLNDEYNPLLKKIRKTNAEPSFETLRQKPEIMVQIYSYLPIRDRIYQLSLVDREFSRDNIRGGIVSATYGAGINLKQALLELERWALEEFERFSDENALRDRELNPVILIYGPRTTEYHQERIAKIRHVIEIEAHSYGELLLFSGSNLKNTLVDPKERKRWMAGYVREFFAREKEEWEKQHPRRKHSWLEESLLVQKFIKRYLFDGNIDRLKQMMADSDFLEDYAEYQRHQRFSTNYIEGSGKLIWCLPDLSPSCNVLLLDADEGWKEHRFATCACCRNLVRADLESYRGCHGHGQHAIFCKNCRENLSKENLLGMFCIQCQTQARVEEIFERAPRQQRRRLNPN